MSSNFRSTFRQMIGGQEDMFFDRYWRKEVLLSKAVMPRIPYTSQEFIADYEKGSYNRESLIVTVDDAGVRRMARPLPDWRITETAAQEVSLVMQAIMLPVGPNSMPEVWRQFVDLQYDLCGYLLPDMPPGLQPDGPIAAVDIFYTPGRTSTGGHYDPGDVFYFVLDGEKEWTVEVKPDPGRLLELYASPHETFMRDHSPAKDTMTLSVAPGDCLYVPPFTYHRVSSSGPTLAVSIGLPTYTEATLLRTIIRSLQRQGRKWNIWEPLPSVPQSRKTEYEVAQHETAARIAALIEAMKGTIPATAVSLHQDD